MQCLKGFVASGRLILNYPRCQLARYASVYGTGHDTQAAALPPAEGERLLDYWKSLLQAQPASGGSPLSDKDVRQVLHTALRLRQGKSQASQVPDELLALFRQHYSQLDHPGRLALLRTVASSFGLQPSDIDAAVENWQQLRGQEGPQHTSQAGASNVLSDSPDAAVKAAAQLAAAAMPLYARLFAPLSQQTGGMKFLLDMRSDVLQGIREQPAGAAPLRAFSDSLRSRLAQWFSVGLLQLHRISWEGSSAMLLEKVAAGEAVHEVKGWDDLKCRLDPETRRVYAFMHSAMPEEPLVVLHTALTDHIARSMADLLPHLHTGDSHSGDPHTHIARIEQAGSQRTWEAEPCRVASNEHQPTVAVFYSISSTQPGLSGVELGHFLIKKVARCVQSEFPSISTLCTLSPIPGFSDWLRLQLARATQGLAPSAVLLTAPEAAELEDASAGHLPPSEGHDDQRAAVLLDWALADDVWLHNSRLEAAVRAPLLRLTIHYLLVEKRRGLALDAVANFHLRNGASVLQLNWRADLSPAGLRRSHGIMVNYHYQLDKLQENNRTYLVDGQIAASPLMTTLLDQHG